MHNLKLFEEDFDIIHGVSFGYKYCEDNLYIYGSPHGYIIGLYDLNYENRWEWLSENVRDSLLAVKPDLTKGELYDIYKAIIHLFHGVILHTCRFQKLHSPCAINSKN